MVLKAPLDTQHHAKHERGTPNPRQKPNKALRPHIFVSVPRLWNRIYDRVMAAMRAGSPVARALFERAYASKRAALEAGDLSGGRWAPLWDRLVFSKIRAKLGGEVKYLTTGEGIWGEGEGARKRERAGRAFLRLLFCCLLFCFCFGV